MKIDGLTINGINKSSQPKEPSSASKGKSNSPAANNDAVRVSIRSGGNSGASAGTATATTTTAQSGGSIGGVDGGGDGGDTLN